MARTKEQRKQYAKVRLGRLMRMRELNAPKWMIKSEQIGMVLNRIGMKYNGLGRRSKVADTQRAHRRRPLESSTS